MKPQLGNVMINDFCSPFVTDHKAALQYVKIYLFLGCLTRNLVTGVLVKLIVELYSFLDHSIRQLAVARADPHGWFFLYIWRLQTATCLIMLQYVRLCVFVSSGSTCSTPWSLPFGLKTGAACCLST